MVVFGAGGGSRPSVSQQSNEGIGGGPEGGRTKGIVALALLLGGLFLFFFLFG
jgi:hypothetical protein